MKNSIQFFSTFALLCTIALSWQSCDPPSSPGCASDDLFTTGISVTHYQLNNAVSFYVQEPVTCDAELAYPYHCHFYRLTFDVAYKDHSGNIMETVTKDINFSNTNAGTNIAPVWTVNDTGGIVDNNNAVLFTISGPTFPNPVKSIDVNMTPYAHEFTSCSDGSGIPPVVLSLDFYSYNGTTQTHHVPMLNSESIYEGNYYPFEDVVVY